MSTCQRDESPTGDGATICGPCTEDTRRALDELARLLPMLRTTAARQAVSATRTARVKGTGHSVGINLHALDVLAEVRMVVTGWLRVMLEDGVSRELPERCGDGFEDTARLCSHLSSRMGLVRHHEAAGEVVAEVLDPGSFVWQGQSIGRPGLVELVEQAVDTHREGDESFTKAAGDRLTEAMDRFVAPDLALRAVVEQGVKISERQVKRWISEQRMVTSRNMEGDVLVMPSSLVQLAATVKRGRRTTAA